MRNLVTPVVQPNINRVDAVKVRDNRDDSAPSFVLVVQFYGTGAEARDAGRFELIARDTLGSNTLSLNPTPSGYGDVILLNEHSLINNACTTLGTAYDNAPGNRAAKRNAVLDAAYAIGMISASLAVS